MHKQWLKNLKLNCSSNVLDIVQFGSSIFENSNPNDIDMAVIFEKIPIKEQLNEAQKIKQVLQKKTGLKIHINSYDLYSLFDKSNFAREGILFYGKSLITKQNFAQRFGLVPKIQIRYDLSNLEKRDKVRFNYALSGRGGNYGLLKKYGGNLIAPKIIEIEPEYEKIFVDRLKEITERIEIKKIFGG